MASEANVFHLFLYPDKRRAVGGPGAESNHHQFFDVCVTLLHRRHYQGLNAGQSL
jgi:hypothetical protein